MDSKNLKLQAARFVCNYPSSPLYDSVAGRIAASHVAKYTRWGQEGKKFRLFQDAQLFITEIGPGGMSIEGEDYSADLHFMNLIREIRDVLTDNIRFTGVKNEIRAFSFRCAYFLKHELPERLRPVLTSHFIKNIPDEYVKKFDSEPLRIEFPSFTFEMTSTMECTILTHVIDTEELIGSAFPNTYKDCEPGGLVVELIFRSSSESDGIKMETFLELMDKIKEESFTIAKMIVENIPEPAEG